MPALPPSPRARGAATVSAAAGKNPAASKPAALEDMIRAAKKPAATTGKPATASSSKAALRAIVLPGNNHQMLLDALARRPWWHATCEKGLDASSSDFWWGGNGQPFEWKGAAPRTLVNKMSVHGGLVVKSRLALNLRRYARAAKIDPASLVPLSFVLTAGP